MALGAALAVRWFHEPQFATSQLGWSFHTLWGGIDAGKLCFRPRVVGVVEIWKYF